MKNRVLFLVLNNNCNLNCDYCFYQQDKHRKKDNSLGVEDISRLMDQLPGLGFNEVTITGGEPLLNMSLLKETIIKCHSLGITTNLNTNGLLLNDKNARSLHEVGIQNLYINSVYLDTNEIDRLMVLKDFYNISVIHVIHKRNIELSQEICRQVRDAGFSLIVQPAFISSATEKQKNLSLRNIGPSERLMFMTLFDRYSNNKTYRDLVHNYYSSDSQKPDFCDMGSRRFVLDTNGDVCRCFHLYKNPIGNIRSKSLRDIIKKTDIKSSVKSSECFGEHCLSLFA